MITVAGLRDRFGFLTDFDMPPDFVCHDYFHCLIAKYSGETSLQEAAERFAAAIAAIDGQPRGFT